MRGLGLQAIFYTVLGTFSCTSCIMHSYMLLLCHRNNSEMVSSFLKSAFVDIFWRKMQKTTWIFNLILMPS